MLIYICEDSQSDRARLLYFLNKFRNETGSVFTVHWFTTADKMLEEYGGSDPKPEIIFLDIYMSGTDGMSAAEKLTEIGCKSGIIFTTSSDSHALSAFRVNADGYLLKPYTYDQLKRTLDRYSSAFASSRKTISVTFNREETKIPLGNIRSVESFNHCTYFYTLDKEYKSVHPISEFRSSFCSEESFICCGKSSIVNLNFIKKCEDCIILLDNGREISVPVRIRKSVEREVASYLEQGF